jgi:murein DD-endopeptidase MepM/ murein hydrolase activator NlpD
MNKIQVTLQYNGRTWNANQRTAVTMLVVIAILLALFVLSFLYFFNRVNEIESLKKQLMLERTINSTLSREINESTNGIAKIAKSITGNASQTHSVEYKHIIDKIQLYSVLQSMQANLSVIDKHLSTKVSQFRGIINVAKMNGETAVLEGINIAQRSQSVSSTQSPSKIQKAGISYQTSITSSIRQSIHDIAIKQKGLKILQEYISSMPLGSPILDGRFVSGFGNRNHPIHHREKMHYGVDFAGAFRAKIISTGDGTIEKALYNPSYGNYVVVRHKNNIRTLYAHMSAIKVKPGQKVKTGAVLGLQGSTGTSTGSHVHYEVMVGDKHIDPLNFIRAKSLL